MTTAETGRARVPAALHAELTEYTSLVRALRTVRTLDLTTHLLQHAAQRRDNNLDHEPDTWTAWPLIDCPVPEWSLRDEIQQLGDTVVQQLTRAAEGGEGIHCHSDHDYDHNPDLDELSQTAVNYLVLHAGALLVHILNFMADQRPTAPGSMQNRLSPMNWEDVISLLAVSDVVDPTIVERAQTRLARVYGPSNVRATQRRSSVISAKAQFAVLASVAEDQLLAPPSVPQTSRKEVKGNHHPDRPKNRAPPGRSSSNKKEEGNCAPSLIDLDMDA